MDEALLVDGTDIETLGIIENWDGVLSVAAERGGPLLIPGRDGAVHVPGLAVAAGVIPIPFALFGDDVTGFNDALRSLRRLVPPGKVLDVVRRLSYDTGVEDQHASCTYLSGLDPKLVNAASGRLVLTLTNLDGRWYGEDDVVINAAGAHVIQGDTRTRRMFITLTGGVAPVLTNSIGQSLTFAGNPGVGAAAVTVNPEAMTATQSGADVSGLLSWSGRFPFELDPREGANTIAITGGGTFNIAYRPAFL